jgi:hypothetical protein
MRKNGATRGGELRPKTLAIENLQRGAFAPAG